VVNLLENRCKMLNISSENIQENLQDVVIQFLQEDSHRRLQILRELGIGRYDFLTKISLNEVNIICVMKFFQNPSRLKFPQLIEADLSGLNLDGVNFIRGNLTGANLQGTSLIDADLIFANFTNANLTGANLRGAILNETIWQGSLVEGCCFQSAIGLTTKQRQNLLSRGAVFN
jgi:Pentapeptide repeats (8 copies)